jgi:hypothetical protein
MIRQTVGRASFVLALLAAPIAAAAEPDACAMAARAPTPADSAAAERLAARVLASEGAANAVIQTAFADNVLVLNPTDPGRNRCIARSVFVDMMNREFTALQRGLTGLRATDKVQVAGDHLHVESVWRGRVEGADVWADSIKDLTLRAGQIVAIETRHSPGGNLKAALEAGGFFVERAPHDAR